MPYAPWATEAQIEEDLLITRVVVAIFGDPFLARQAAMRGGTVLHKIHLAPPARYSEDIDLVAVGDRPRGDIVRALRRAVSSVIRASPVSDRLERFLLAIRNTAKESAIARLTWEYAPTSASPPMMKLKVEINVTEREPAFPLVPLAYAPPAARGGDDRCRHVL